MPIRTHIRWLFLQQLQVKKEENVKHAFRVFDKDQDGFISAPELKAFFNQLGELTLTEEDARFGH